jgi:hypothetical protein
MDNPIPPEDMLAVDGAQDMTLDLLLAPIRQVYFDARFVRSLQDNRHLADEVSDGIW